MTKTSTLNAALPSATPNEAEIEAWRALPRDEQLRLLRAELDHPDCSRITKLTMDQIREEGRALAAKLRNG